MTYLFSGTWAYVFCVYGLNYIFSITLSSVAAQMSAVVSAFLGFCVAGIYSPELWQIANKVGGRGWMIPALSPIRWYWAYLLTAEAHLLSPLTAEGASGT